MFLKSSVITEMLFMSDAIARFELLCVRSSGESVPVTVEIGRPYVVRRIEGADFARCPATAQGLFEKGPDISGDDPFEAFVLAIRYIDRILTDFVHDGGRIHYTDGKTKFEIAAHVVSN